MKRKPNECSRIGGAGSLPRMPRRGFLSLAISGSSFAILGNGFAAGPPAPGSEEAALDLDHASIGGDDGPQGDLNPNTRWMLEAKWGLFSHFLPRLPGAEEVALPSADDWNRKVDAFQVARLADQLAELKVRYYFLTVGSEDGFFCSPNPVLEKGAGDAGGVCSKRDLIADLAEALSSRDIRMGISLPALGGAEGGAVRKQYLEAISEWSRRWGKAISAWWIDQAKLTDPAAYDALADALKAGNPDAIVAFNTGPLKLTYRLQEPPTEREDFFAGQVDYYLPTCAVRSFDKRKFWVGPNFHGSLVHFITFLGANWGTGDPRFPDDLVKGWTRHTNNYSGTVTWDVPLDESGMIAAAHLGQIKALSDYMSA